MFKMLGRIFSKSVPWTNITDSTWRTDNGAAVQMSDAELAEHFKGCIADARLVAAELCKRGWRCHVSVRNSPRQLNTHGEWWFSPEFSALSVYIDKQTSETL